MKYIYTIIFTLLTPFILLRLYCKGIKSPTYRQRWQERLAIYSSQHPQNSLWFHAVSVGEAEALFPLIKRLQADDPKKSILITTTTPTGSSRVKMVLGDTVSHVYLPYDIPYVLHNFFHHFKPKIAVIMEKEIWPNLFSECCKRKIPLFIINARLSENSAHNYKKIPRLVIPALKNVTHILTQTEEDRQHFISIGVAQNKLSISGNLKFDVIVSKELLAQGKLLKNTLFRNRFVWIVASTHKGEEAIIISCYQALKKEIPELLLLLVPRHPERFIEVKALANEEKMNVIMRSANKHCRTETDIYIADTLGELKMLYAAADICFVGGSLVPVGGHNILEPLAVGTPTLFGPYMLNFKEISAHVISQQACIQCQTEQDIVLSIKNLYQNSAYNQLLIQNGHAFLNKNIGATQNTIQTLSSYL